MSLLETRDLVAFYGDFQALYGITTHVDEGETIAIVGANGAGKSTYLSAITGLRKAPREMIEFDGKAIGSMPPAQILARGIAMVPEGRKLFASLNVEENLLVGNYGRKIKGPWTLNRVYSLFPILKERRNQAVMSLSGGQQQMVALGRALMSNPRLLLCDEISLGLAPAVIKDIYQAIAEISREGASVMIVEQNIEQALSVSNRIYCLLEGRVTLSGRPGDITRDQITAAYFGG